MIDDNKFKEVVKEEGETMLLQANRTRGEDGTVDGVSATNLSGTGPKRRTSTHPPDDYAVMCVKHLLLCYYSFSSALINCIIASRIIQVAYKIHVGN
jgi:hypothetical protein